ncbi:hypothetical protein HPB49_016255 [Dermacentor silvarum]|uniref:Uncharacterized protein n=1 Tax=Dermacentor silvarum TaxID=543639 RepID=A0ACB8CYA0_DERSI|nr:hypothetical protein HPB49_016255 [Dermacentor silvarum]
MERTEWQLVQSKSAKHKQAAERGKSQPNASRSFQDGARVGAKSSRRAAALKRVIAASRMAELPSTHRKNIVRPPGGLNLRKTSCYGISTTIFTATGITATQASTDLVCPDVLQNNVVVCTENEDNDRKILALKKIRVDDKEHEVVVLIVHRGNPSVRGVKRIKEAGSQSLYIRDGQEIVRFYLQKKEIEVCSTCIRFGHLADVCPTPVVNVCHNCGAKDPKQEHSCQVMCKLCGNGHPTSYKACQQKYQTPFVVRQKRKEREMECAFNLDLRRDFPTLEPRLPVCLSTLETEPRFPPRRNVSPKKRMENLLEHQLDPLPRNRYLLDIKIEKGPFLDDIAALEATNKQEGSNRVVRTRQIVVIIIDLSSRDKRVEALGSPTSQVIYTRICRRHQLSHHKSPEYAVACKD